MVFTSPVFLFLFLPAVLLAYALLRRLSQKNMLLLVFSLVFYAWGELLFIVLLLASTLINYGLGRWVDQDNTPQVRKRAMMAAVALNIGLLAFFKYANLIVATLNGLFAGLDLPPLPESNIPLPIGISFFTFHALSYILDIYFGKSRAATKLQDVALYIFFFPQLVAGPILRWSGIAPQLAARRVTADEFADGVRRFIIGLGKKVIIANAVALPADQIFALPAEQLTPTLAWWGLVCYTLQIYFDFSGYSDMAVGLGKMFGFRFLENFNYPYIARSVQDFWRRWHISLSTWFRDYLYIPLGGDRAGTFNTYRNLMLVFLLCGLWHGASWTFVLWGAWHGAFLVFERLGLGAALARLPSLLGHAYTLLAVMLGWVLFRADDFGHALGYYSALFGLHEAVNPEAVQRYMGRQVVSSVMLGLLFAAPLWPWLLQRLAALGGHVPSRLRTPLALAGHGLHSLLLTAMLLVCCAWIAAGTYNPFIYFRF